MFSRVSAKSKFLYSHFQNVRKSSSFATSETRSKFGAVLLCGLMTIGVVVSNSTACIDSKEGTKIEKENLAKWATAPTRK